jgi:predicted nucleic acid-binding protein
MTLRDIRAKDRVFIDANIFVYHFNGISLECKHLLSRCSQEIIDGYTSAFVVAEVIHRLMIAEALRKSLIRAKNPVKQLKNHPEIVTQLSDYTADVSKIHTMNITILEFDRKAIEVSADIRQKEGLLTNDSLILAMMKIAGLSKLATRDNDFERIPWLQLYQPSDI